MEAWIPASNIDDNQHKKIRVNPHLKISENLHFKKALNYSFLLLKYRPRSKREITLRLKRKRFPSLVIKEVLAYLEEYNYINDDELVRLLVARGREKGWGQRKISFTLRRMGVSDNLIDKSLGDKSVYRKEIREIIAKKSRSYDKERNKYQKIVRYLKGKGFYEDDIFQELQNQGVDEFAE